MSKEREWAEWYARTVVARQPRVAPLCRVELVKIPRVSPARAKRVARLVAKQHDEHIAAMKAERDALELRRFRAEHGRRFAKALALAGAAAQVDRERASKPKPPAWAKGGMVSLGEALRGISL